MPAQTLPQERRKPKYQMVAALEALTDAEHAEIRAVAHFGTVTDVQRGAESTLHRRNAVAAICSDDAKRFHGMSFEALTQDSGKLLEFGRSVVKDMAFLLNLHFHRPGTEALSNLLQYTDTMTHLIMKQNLTLPFSYLNEEWTGCALAEASKLGWNKEPTEKYVYGKPELRVLLKHVLTNSAISAEVALQNAFAWLVGFNTGARPTALGTSNTLHGTQGEYLKLKHVTLDRERSGPSRLNFRLTIDFGWIKDQNHLRDRQPKKLTFALHSLLSLENVEVDATLYFIVIALNRGWFAEHADLQSVLNGQDSKIKFEPSRLNDCIFAANGPDGRGLDLNNVCTAQALIDFLQHCSPHCKLPSASSYVWKRELSSDARKCHRRSILELLHHMDEGNTFVNSYKYGTRDLDLARLPSDDTITPADKMRSYTSPVDSRNPALQTEEIPEVEEGLGRVYLQRATAGLKMPSNTYFHLSMHPHNPILHAMMISGVDLALARPDPLPTQSGPLQAAPKVPWAQEEDTSLKEDPLVKEAIKRVEAAVKLGDNAEISQTRYALKLAKKYWQKNHDKSLSGAASTKSANVEERDALQESIEAFVVVPQKDLMPQEENAFEDEEVRPLKDGDVPDSLSLMAKARSNYLEYLTTLAPPAPRMNQTCNLCLKDPTLSDALRRKEYSIISMPTHKACKMHHKYAVASRAVGLVFGVFGYAKCPLCHRMLRMSRRDHNEGEEDTFARHCSIFHLELLD